MITPGRAQIIKALVTSLNLEIRLYTQYLDLLAKEEQSIIKFSPEEVTKSAAERESFHTLILGAQGRRIELLRRLAVNSNTATPVLSDVIRNHCTQEEAKELNSLAEKLKILVSQTKQRTTEHSELAGFSLGMVNSLISIVYSATQSVLDLYNSQGLRKQTYQPVSTRSAVMCKA